MEEKNVSIIFATISDDGAQNAPFLKDVFFTQETDKYFANVAKILGLQLLECNIHPQANPFMKLVCQKDSSLFN